MCIAEVVLICSLSCLMSSFLADLPHACECLVWLYSMLLMRLQRGSPSWDEQSCLQRLQAFSSCPSHAGDKGPSHYFAMFAPIRPWHG